MRRLVVLTVAAIALAAALAGLRPAAADDRRPRVTVAGASLFPTEPLAPGSVLSSEVTVTNPTARPAQLRVRLRDLVDDDNGCPAVESLAGDTTCGAGGGDLGRALQVRFGSGDWMPLRALAGGTTVAPLAARSTSTVQAELRLPMSSGNETQTDRVSFRVGLSLTDVVGAGRDDDEVVLAGLLPAGTGSPSPAVLPVAVGLASVLAVVVCSIGASRLAARARARRGRVAAPATT